MAIIVPQASIIWKNRMSSESFTDLEKKIDQLVELSQHLQKENASLQLSKTDLLKERGELLENNEQARSRIEGMITRLKALNAEG